MLKFQVGHPVVVELIDTKDESKYRFGCKAGDSQVVSVEEVRRSVRPRLQRLFPVHHHVSDGGQAVWKRDEGDMNNVAGTCPDLRAGFRFLIRRKEGGEDENKERLKKPQ